MLTDAATACFIAGLGLVLCTAGARIAGRWTADPGQVLSGAGVEESIGLAASLVGLTILLWWVLSLIIACAAALLFHAGHHRAGLAIGRYSPRFMRRFAAVLLGMQLLAAPIAAAHQPPTPAANAAAIADTAPVSATVPVSTTVPAFNAVPASTATDSVTPPNPLWQPSGTYPSDRTGTEWKPPSPVPTNGIVLDRPAARDDADQSEQRHVTVLPGDTLWGIAADFLGPYATDVEIAEEWPRWYAANQRIIGPNPGLIYPGQVLRAPEGQP